MNGWQLRHSVRFSPRQPLLGGGEEFGVILGQGEATSGQRRHQPGGDL